MKKLITHMALISLAIVSVNALAQVSIRRDTRVADSTRVLNTSQQSTQAVQAVQPAQGVQQLPSTQTASAQYQSTSASKKFYSIDPTAFSSSWGTYEIPKLQKEGAYLNSGSDNAAPYLVAPVNLPHNATVTNMKIIFYDASSSQDLQAILWRSGPHSWGPDSYNLGEVRSSSNSGLVTQNKAINTKVDNENHSYCFTVRPADGKPWPTSGELKIKRVTIEYMEE